MIIFWLQICLSIISCGSQAVRMLNNIQGIVLSKFLLLGAYSILHYSMACRIHKDNQSRVAKQIIWVYGVWFVLALTQCLAIILNCCYQWSWQDTILLGFATIGAITLFIYSKIMKINFNEISIQGSLSIICKAIPQLFFSYKIWKDGGGGISPIMIVLSNIIIIIRLYQIWKNISLNGWQKNILWLFISETANEISFAIMTIIWAIRVF